MMGDRKRLRSLNSERLDRAIVAAIINDVMAHIDDVARSSPSVSANIGSELLCISNVTVYIGIVLSLVGKALTD